MDRKRSKLFKKKIKIKLSKYLYISTLLNINYKEKSPKAYLSILKVT